MNTHDILFYLFSLAAIGCSFSVVTTSNPIHAILFVVGAFAGAGSLLMLFGAEYLAILFFILYIGAIAIVFLFVVMMLNIKQAELKETLRGKLVRYFPLGAIIAFVSLFALLYVIINDSVILYSYSNLNSLSPLTQSIESNILDNPYIEWYSLLDAVTNVEGLGLLLYTHYFLQFILAAMLLLVAMILVIVLTGFKHDYVKHQDLFTQMSRESDQAWTSWNGK